MFANVVNFSAIMVAFISLVIAYKALTHERSSSSSQFRIAWTNQVVEWASRCIMVLSKIYAHLKTCDTLCNADKEANLAELSGLIDHGRLLFENKKDNEVGLENLPAYQGLRPRFLDALVNAYLAYLYANDQTRSSKADYVLKSKKEFVSDIQEIIEPKWFYEKAKEYSQYPDEVKNND